MNGRIMAPATDLAIKLCSWQKTCPTGRLTSDYSHPPECQCNGTGLVYVLDNSVKVLCPCLAAYDGVNHYLDATDGFRCCKLWLHDAGKEGPDCSLCGGRGWTPSTDLAVWAKAALNILDTSGYIVIAKDGVSLVGLPDKPQQKDRVWVSGCGLPALQSALAQVMAL